MFDIDKWIEIFESIKRHKLRTFLTGFGVAWGIFMLVILLGSGQGLYQGVSSNFAGYAQNLVTVFPGVTSQPYEGLPTERRVEVSLDDLRLLQENVRSINKLSPESSQNTDQVYYDDNSGDFQITGVYPDFFDIMIFKQPFGRFINPLDQQESRNIAVVGPKAMDLLFGEDSPVGKHITIQNNNFKVVGVFETSEGQMRFGQDEDAIYIPHSSFVQAFGQEDGVGRFYMTPEEGYTGTDLEDRTKSYLGNHLRFHADDPRALRTFNMEDQVQNFTALFSGVNIFLWIVGLSTLMGGVVGVGNIMLVTVKERTREIGIRRALGATPGSILNMIILEAIFITTLSGYIGLFLGIMLLNGIRILMERAAIDLGILGPPSVDLNIAIGATIVLILSGAVAGFIPARNASKTKPIEALRYE